MVKQSEVKKSAATPKKKLSKQREEYVNKKSREKEDTIFQPPEGNFKMMISTGSTLGDLAISGGKVRGGGIPGGIVVEIGGLPSMGKTVYLCEIAGDVQRKGGSTIYMDPEGRLSTTFAQLFGFEISEEKIESPDTPIDMFEIIRNWEPERNDVVNAVFVDSTAALSSDLEMENKKDEYQRRAKLFSQELRKHSKMIKEKNLLIVCSNQLRETVNAMPGQEKYYTPGGKAFDFYASLQIRLTKNKGGYEMKRKKTIHGTQEERTVGVASQMKVVKSSIWKPYRTAPLYIIFDYGSDTIRANLEFTKKFSDESVYYAGNQKLSNSLEDSIQTVEDHDLEDELREATIDIWEKVEKEFNSNRKKKKR